MKIVYSVPVTQAPVSQELRRLIKCAPWLIAHIELTSEEWEELYQEVAASPLGGRWLFPPTDELYFCGIRVIRPAKP